MKQLFNKGLYKEGLKQTAVVAIIFFCITELVSVFTTIGKVFDSIYYAAQIGRIEKTLIDGSDFSMAFMLSFVLFVPLMILVAFNFLNTRNKSDFYHSIPHKRKTIYCSFTLSILTWIVGIFVICSLTSLSIYFFNAQYFSIGFASIFTYLFTLLSACVLVLGAGLLAVSITGTTFSNIVTAALILFLPRAIMLMFSQGIQTKTPVLSESALGMLSEHGYNLAFGTACQILGISIGTQDIFAEVSYGVYSLILGVIFILLGSILFSLRKSEAAGSPALSKRVHSIIRIALSFFISAIASMSLAVNEDAGMNVIMLYVTSLVIYFVYEVITKKSFKSIPKTLPGLGVLVGLNAVFIISLSLISSAMMNVNWDVERIDSISISYRQDAYESPSYEDYVMDDTKIKDAKVLQVTSKLLDENQKAAKVDENNFYYYSGSFDHIVIRMKNGKTYHRRLFLTDEDSLTFQKAILDSELKESIFSGIPEDPGTISSEFRGLSLSEGDNQKIYETFKKELSDLSYEDWAHYQLTNGSLSSTFYDAANISASESADIAVSYTTTQKNMPEFYPTITLTGYYGIKTYKSVYSISPAVMPKTFAMLTELGNVSSLEKIKEYWDIYEEKGLRYTDYNNPQDEEGGSSLYGLTISGFNPKTGDTISEYYNYDYPVENASPAIQSILSSAQNAIKKGITEIDPTKPVVYIEMNVEEYVNRDGGTYVTSSSQSLYTINVDAKDFPSSPAKY